MRNLLASALLVLLGCASGQWGSVVDGVRLGARVDPADPGSMVLTLENGSTGSIGYNLCTSSIERLDGSRWTRVEEDRACTMELRMLAPGGTDQFTVGLPAGAPPGEYRYTTSVNRDDRDDSVTVSSNSFRIGG